MKKGMSKNHWRVLERERETNDFEPWFVSMSHCNGTSRLYMTTCTVHRRLPPERRNFHVTSQSQVWSGSSQTTVAENPNT